MLKLEYLDHVTITSRDPARSVRFYTEVLGLVRGPEWPGELVMLRCGPTYLAIAAWAEGKPLSPQPPITVDHFAFRVSAETFARAKIELDAHGIAIDHVSDHGINQSLYFRDPDGHLVELACYEIPGKFEKMPRMPARS
jgi:catechol 2,3-dioxygenase-like lactoylglutathione lyase family enzyme